MVNWTFIYFILNLSASIVGFGAGLLWTACGNYISQCATNENKGFFNSYFWAIFMASNVIGNLIAAIVLMKSDTQVTYYIVMTLVSLLGSSIFLLIKPPLE